MVDKIAFTPRVQTPAFKGIAEEAAPVIVEQAKDETDNKDYSGLLTGTLAALSAFGLGLVARKPKTVEKVVEKVVTETAHEAPKAFKKLTPKEQEAIWKAAAKNNKYMYIAEQSSQKTTALSDNLINASNPQIRTEISPELVKLRHDMQARAALSQAESINKSFETNAQKIYDSNVQMRPAELTGKAYTDKELELLEAFNPQAYKHRMINTINHNNAVERAEKNSIGNLVSNSERAGLNKVKRTAQRRENMSQHLANGPHKNQFIRGNYSYIVENGKVVKILDGQTEKGKVRIITDEKKIAKHLAKHKINPLTISTNSEFENMFATTINNTAA